MLLTAIPGQFRFTIARVDIQRFTRRIEKERTMARSSPMFGAPPCRESRRNFHIYDDRHDFIDSMRRVSSGDIHTTRDGDDRPPAP